MTDPLRARLLEMALLDRVQREVNPPPRALELELWRMQAEIKLRRLEESDLERWGRCGAEAA